MIVARQMVFHGESGPANPTVQVRAGERVRLVLVNEDAGFDHDLSIPGWSLATSTLHGTGRTSIEFQAPDYPGNGRLPLLAASDDDERNHSGTSSNWVIG